MRTAGLTASAHRLAFDGTTIRLESALPEVVDELRRRLVPYYALDRAVPAEPDLTVRIAATPLDDAPAPDGARPFDIQPHPGVHRYRRRGLLADDGPRRHVVLRETGTRCLIDRSTREISFAGDVSTEGARRELARDVRRTIRDVVNARLIAAGHVELHASGVGRDGRILAVAGASGSGKTSYLMAILGASDARLVCNGRLFVRSCADGLECVGVPEHVLLRPGVAMLYRDRFPALADALEVAGTADPWRTRPNDKVSVQMREVLDVFGTSPMPVGRLRTLLRPTPGVQDVAAVGAAGARAAMGEVVQPPASVRRRFWHGLCELDDDAYAAAAWAVIDAADRVAVLRVPVPARGVVAPATLTRVTALC